MRALGLTAAKDLLGQSMIDPFLYPDYYRQELAPSLLTVI